MFPVAEKYCPVWLLTLQAPNTLSKDLRKTRKVKLAGVISSNSHLKGCTTGIADRMAADYESFVAAGCRADAAAHKARLLQLLNACKAAVSWLDLPELQVLSGPVLEAALKHGVAEVVGLAQQCARQPNDAGSSVRGDGAADTHAAGSDVQSKLKKLAVLKVTADALEATGVAAAVKKLRKHSNAEVGAAASSVIASWRASVTNAE